MRKTLSTLLMMLLSVSLLLPACPGTVSAAAEGDGGKIEVRLAWWGGNTRNEYMNSMLDLYEEQHPNVTVIRDYSSWNDYWIKYATQAATGTAPDVVEHTMMTLAEYAGKGLIRPLDDFVESGAIDLSDFSEAAINAGVYKGQQDLILFGMTASGFLYNKTLLEEYGCELPPAEWTAEEMHEYMKEVRQLIPEDIYLFDSDCGNEHILETYARSIGKSLYNEDGTGFGIDKEDMIALFEYWEELRADGAVAPSMIVEESANLAPEESYNATGRAVFTLVNTNFLQTYWAPGNYEIYLMPHPIYGEKHGDYLQPTGFCISSTVSDEVAAAAADLINWLVNDVEANKLFHEDLGMPGSETVTAALNEEATEPIKIFHEYMEESVLPYAGEVDYRAEGSAEVMTMYKLKYQEVSSGQKDIPTAVDEIFAEAEKILNG